MKINGGIYPTMLVAYKETGEIDYNAMGALIDWYIEEGVHGIFALCHSTEVHCLSLEERLKLGGFVLDRVAGRVPVVMGGITAYTIEEQIEEAKLFAKLDPTALVLISNRLDGEGEDALINNMKTVMAAIPDNVTLGIYECPHPYKRVLTDREVKFIVGTGRFAFIKDTCCDVETMRRRAEIARGSDFGLFNANCATFHESLSIGYDGFSGIMANFHPRLYSWVYENADDPRCAKLNALFGVTSLIEMRCYPIPAKKYLKEYAGLPITPVCRSVEDTNPSTVSAEVRAIYDQTKEAHELIGVPMRRYTEPDFISYDARAELQSIVDRENGVYLEHPHTCLLSDNKTVLAVYSKCHGFGQITMKKSFDGGKSWSERLPVPDSFSTSMECPTVFRMEDREGRSRFCLFTGRYPIRMSVSEDDGESWSELQPIGDFGGMFISTVIKLGDGKYTALFHDDGCYIKGGRDAKAVVYRAGKGTDMRTRLLTYTSPDGGETYDKTPCPHWKLPLSRGDDRWEKIYETYHSKRHADGHFELYSIVTEDGGLTWSAPRMICTHESAKLCEPGAVRSPDGKEIAVFLRDNSRKHNSFVILSRDEGESWSEPREISKKLTGDRHTAAYMPDGRLFITFRDNEKTSPTNWSWVAWVGSYEDAVSGADGDCRLLLKKNYESYDCAYPGLVTLPDGTLLCTTYGTWTKGETPYIISVRLTPEELGSLPHEDK